MTGNEPSAAGTPPADNPPACGDTQPQEQPPAAVRSNNSRDRLMPPGGWQSWRASNVCGPKKFSRREIREESKDAGFRNQKGLTKLKSKV